MRYVGLLGGALALVLSLGDPAQAQLRDLIGTPGEGEQVTTEQILAKQGCDPGRLVQALQESGVAASQANVPLPPKWRIYLPQGDCHRPAPVEMALASQLIRLTPAPQVVSVAPQVARAPRAVTTPPRRARAVASASRKPEVIITPGVTTKDLDAVNRRIDGLEKKVEEKPPSVIITTPAPTPPAVAPPVAPPKGADQKAREIAQKSDWILGSFSWSILSWIFSWYTLIIVVLLVVLVVVVLKRRRLIVWNRRQTNL